MKRDAIEQRPERRHDKDEQRQPGGGAKPGRTPAAHRGDGKHDGQSFDRLDQRGEERRRHRSAGVKQAVDHKSLRK
jgi:hypothetical protein